MIASTGDVDTYDQMLERFRSGATPQEQLRHLYTLTEFDDEALLMRTCEFAMSDDVKTQNAPFVLAQAIGNRHHGAAAWAFVRDHWDEANERFPSNTIVRMVSGVRLLNTPGAVDDTQSFFATHPIAQAAKTLEQILERQRVNAALRTRDADTLARTSPVDTLRLEKSRNSPGAVVESAELVRGSGVGNRRHEPSSPNNPVRRPTMTQYLLSVWHDDVYEDNDVNDADTQRMFAQVDAFNNEIQESGAWVFGGGLLPTTSATVVRSAAGRCR